MPNAFIRKLNDKDGNVILPASRAAGIYFNDDSVLQDYVASEGVMKKALGDKNGKDLTSYVTGLSVNGRTVTYTKGDGTSGTIQTQDTNTTYSAFKGATSSAAGGTGLVPAPAAGQQTRYLRGDGTWQTPPNTTYSNATTSTDGLMSSEDKTKLDGIATGANKYTHPSYTNRTSGLYKITVDATGHVSAATAVTKSDITALGIPGQDTNTTYANATTSTDGLMSAEDKVKLNGIAAGANKYTHPSYTAKSSGLYKITVDGLGHVSAVASVTKADITALGIPGSDTNTTYSAFRGATASAAGGSGLVPAPAAGQNTRYLRGDGTWQTPPNTTYGVATDEANGLMSAADKAKLDGIASGANNYAHPTFTARNTGLYQATANNQGHVSAATAVTKSDITALGIPGQDTNTTYANATTSKDGLMSSEDKTKLDGIATGANKYTHPSYTSRGSGLYKITVDGSGHVSAATAVTKADITALGIPGSDTNTTYSVFRGATSSAAGSSGLVPAPSTGYTSRYLRGDGTWQTPPNTTYSTFKAATASAAGGSGLVPAPAAGENDEYLRGDGTWATPPNTTYTNATSSKAGLMSSTDKAKLDGIASGANKTTVDTALSTSSTNPVRNSVVTTALNGKAATSHTHGAATTSTAGFMSAADKTLLNSLTNSVIVDTSWGSTVSDIP